MLNKASHQGITIPMTPIVDANTNKQFEIMRYAEWLNTEAKRNNNGSHQERCRKYTEDALRTITVNGQEFRPFAPFRHVLSAHKTLTRGQAVTLSIIILGAGLGLLFYGVKLVIVIIAMITLMYLGSLLLDFWLAVQALSQSTEEQFDDATIHALAGADWPGYTILCPLYREAEVAPQFVRAMQAMDYPADKLQILFLTEEDDVETREAIKAMHLPPHFSVVTVPAGQPRTKPRACNFGLLQATGDYVVIYDAEDIPDPLQLKKAVLTFANHGPDLACVQAKLNYYNSRQNLLTRYFTIEYSLWFDLMLPGMQKMKLPLPLGGTSNHFSMEALHKVGAWDPFNVTEDCDLGLRLANSHLKTVVLDSTTYEEANSQVKNWIRQRSRWIKGYLLTYLVYMRQPLRYLRWGRLRELFSLQLIIGGKTAVLLINPLVWAMLVIYILFRPIVGDVYHVLFPGPVLYMGTLCLIFGNFFYTYIHLVGCMKRGHYSLIKWALFIPIYWVMMSVAAFLAFFQLIFKPHYWEKTKHGLHLHASQLSVSNVTVEEEPETIVTMLSPAITSTNGRPLRLSAPYTSSANTEETEKHESIANMSLPTLTNIESRAERHPNRTLWQHRLPDPWLIATFVITCIASIASCWYFFQHHQILLYGDAISHLRVARRVFDSATPGLAQLGGVWLPLPQILMLPFIWNDNLWRTGLAGSFPSMLCYIISAIYLFFSARRLTHDSRASFVGTLLFILNPNILYLQSTPLSEIVYAATSIMACYYFLAWTQDNHPKHLIWMAASIFLATLVRFDGWGLFLALLVLIAIIGWIKLQHWAQIEGSLLVFGTLAGFGIGLWFLWDKVIFGDPLYFHHYLFSSALATEYYTYHNLPLSIFSYVFLSIETVGPILFVLAAIAVIIFVFRRRLAPDMFGAMAFLIPFVFYILIFYLGQDTVFLPGFGPANTSQFLWNVRFGSQSVAPVALFIAILAERRSIAVPRHLWAKVGQIILAVAIGLQTILTTYGGIVSLQDGMYGFSCAPTESITIYLAQHYDGGRILEDANAFHITESDVGIKLKDTIYEGSAELWKKALNEPASMVEWIILSPDEPNDPIANHIDLKSPAFLSQFTLVVQEKDSINYSVHHLSLYHRNGRTPLPTRPIPSNLLTDHRLCSNWGI
jgi:cellulose synthase/poly-beta-1,6-N-acetylglucosamine synthase-like glycosyltransferase